MYLFFCEKEKVPKEIARAPRPFGQPCDCRTGRGTVKLAALKQSQRLLPPVSTSAGRGTQGTFKIRDEVTYEAALRPPETRHPTPSVYCSCHDPPGAKRCGAPRLCPTASGFGRKSAAGKRPQAGRKQAAKFSILYRSRFCVKRRLARELSAG